MNKQQVSALNRKVASVLDDLRLHGHVTREVVPNKKGTKFAVLVQSISLEVGSFSPDDHKKIAKALVEKGMTVKTKYNRLYVTK